MPTNAKIEAAKDAEAQKAKRAFFKHLKEHPRCADAWYTPRQEFPDKEKLCAKAKRLHAVWWAKEEA